MWINKQWAMKETEHVFRPAFWFLPVKWSQIQHIKEHISLNFPHLITLSMQVQRTKDGKYLSMTK